RNNSLWPCRAKPFTMPSDLDSTRARPGRFCVMMHALPGGVSWWMPRVIRWGRRCVGLQAWGSEARENITAPEMHEDIKAPRQHHAGDRSACPRMNDRCRGRVWQGYTSPMSLSASGPLVASRTLLATGQRCRVGGGGFEPL